MSTPSGKPTLHHLSNSQSQRVVWLLEELEIPYELVTHLRDPKTFLSPASLKAVSPHGKAPMLITADGQNIIETSAIIAYLIKTYDHAAKFQGSGPDAWLRDEMLTSFATSVQSFNSLKLFVDMGALSDNTSGNFIQPRVSTALQYLASELGEEDYLMGKEPGRPDFLLSYTVDSVVQRGVVDLPPRLKAWRERVLAREAWKRAIEKPGVPYDLAAIGRKNPAL